MTEEFNLSEEEQVFRLWNETIYYFRTEKVKEFIRRLKGFCKKEVCLDVLEEIDKLAGDKLIE